MTSRDVIAWTRWAEAGGSPRERQRRGERVRAHIFPEGLGFVERSMREHAVAYVDELFKGGEPESWEGYPEPCEPGTSPAPVAAMATPAPSTALPKSARARERWSGLISPESPAHRRGSRRDGTLAAAESMRERARGSPFDAEPQPVPKSPRKW